MSTEKEGWSLEAYRRHNDSIEVRYPEYQLERASRAARAQLADARRLLKVGETEASVNLVIQALEGVIAR